MSGNNNNHTPTERLEQAELQLRQTETRLNMTIRRLSVTGMQYMLYIIVVLALLIFAASQSARAAVPASDNPAQTLIENTTHEVLKQVQRDREAIRENPEHLYRLVEHIAAPHFDFDYMSSLVLGKHWRTATAGQKARFPAEFRNLLVRTYSTAMHQYSDQTIVFAPAQYVPGNTDVTVHTEIRQSTGAAIPLDYRLHLQGSQWRVYDVIIDGVSLVTTYRGTFASVIRRHGMDGLLNSLAKKTQRLARTH